MKVAEDIINLIVLPQLSIHTIPRMFTIEFLNQYLLSTLNKSNNKTPK